RQTDLATATAGTQPGIVMGTLGYMSPEQVRGQPADARSDIFSFGAVLYEMLAGRRAFPGDTPADAVSAILKEEPPDLSAAGQLISPGLERIVRHCLEKNPERRFHSAHDVAFDLEALSVASGAAPAASRARRTGASGIRLAAVAAAALALLVAGVFAGRRWSVAPRDARSDRVTRKRLTFRRGAVLAARLTANGQDVVYSASWDGRPTEVFFTHVGSPESRSLGIEDATLLSVSSSGELAVLQKKSHLFGASGSGTLARVPLAGGAPRQVAEDVTSADWTPDGNDLAVLRDLGSRMAVEFPLGKPVYSSPALLLSSIRVSPDGRRVAVAESDGATHWIDVIDRSGRRTVLAKGFMDIFGLAWDHSGAEIWFGAADSSSFGIFTVSLDGTKRTVAHTLDVEVLHDIAPDGSVLVDREIASRQILGAFGGGHAEHNLSWLEGSDAADLSEDGKTLLFSESGEGGGADGSVYLRPTDGGPAVRLGSGTAGSLSPDGRWASTIRRSSSGARIVLVPTGTGEPKPVPVTGLDEMIFVGFVPPDGKRLWVVGSEPGHGISGYVVDATGGQPRQLAPEVSNGGAESPDGQLFAYTRADRRPVISSVAGGEPRVIDGLDPGDVPIQWSADGRDLFVTHWGELPQPIWRFDVKSARKEIWKELMPADLTGFVEIGWVIITRDGASYAYSCKRLTASDLFLVKGWR
ncbi:MAG: protein kinase domain-containing protein, partial [Acidobacteriota bacterium]